MSLLAGTLQDAGGKVINSVGDIDVGKENINGIITNLTLLSLLVTSLRHNIVKGRTSFNTEYDYIVVGAGTAGSIMASRLSQHPCVKVLLLEAGGEQPVLADVPGFARILLGTDIDWSYMTKPQRYSAFAQQNRSVLWNSGKVLGGSSAINAMLYVRGNKQNFNDWANLGAEGWNYDAVFPYFLKLEDNRNMDQVDPGYHHQNGPMGVEKSKYNPRLREQLIKAMVGLGFPMTDPNGRRQFGVYDIQGTIRNQERCSTAKAYLKPARKRSNLHIVTRAFVRKVIIDKTDGNRASAVEFDHNGKTHVVQIRKSNVTRDGYGEIIISNGAVRTPQILMLSGIGPKEHLEEFNIPVVADLPVGKNLMDHNAACLHYEIDSLLRNAILQQVAPDDIIQYLLLREGPLTYICQNSILAFINGLNNTSPPYDFPMQQMYFMDYNTEDAVRTINLRKDVEEKVYNPYVLRPTVQCCSQLLQPFSRGEIKLDSLDPNQFPSIDPNYYSDRRDINVMVEGLKVCQAVMQHPEMKRLKAKWIDTEKNDFPYCKRYQGDEDMYLGCIARSVITTIWHPTGTARMGHPSDPRSVVDPQLRVIGVKNLRVVNAAIMPIITSGNTNTPTMMIAEKAYDMMKDNIQCRSRYTIQGSKQISDLN